MDAVGTEQSASVLQKGDIRIVCNFPWCIIDTGVVCTAEGIMKMLGKAAVT